jgi:hypothetical protein
VRGRVTSDNDSGDGGSKVLHRAPWTPARSRDVVIDGCGHVTIEWNIIRTLGSLAEKIWCETCEEWRYLWRRATAAEIAGIVPAEIPDECPF